MARNPNGQEVTITGDTVKDGNNTYRLVGEVMRAKLPEFNERGRHTGSEKVRYAWATVDNSMMGVTLSDDKDYAAFAVDGSHFKLVRERNGWFSRDDYKMILPDGTVLGITRDSFKQITKMIEASMEPLLYPGGMVPSQVTDEEMKAIGRSVTAVARAAYESLGALPAQRFGAQGAPRERD